MGLSCTASEIMNPPLMGTFKVLCCAGSVALECCCISCEPDPCWSEERGCCEIASKFLCCYTETQFPPGKDIGCGCCGIALCRTSDDAPPEEGGAPARSARCERKSVDASADRLIVLRPLRLCGQC